jgi:glycosyltransferase involved in cell wall biosynthesis
VRILLVTDSYWPLIGGATRAARQLAYHLTARGHTVGVVTAWQEDTPAHEDDAGVEVWRVRDLTTRVPGISADPHRHTPPPWPDPEASWRLRRIVREFKPDLVHSYGWLTYSCALALAGRTIPLLVSARDYGNICPLRTLVCHERGCERPGLRTCMPDATRFYGKAKGTTAVAGVVGGRALLRRKMHGEHTVSRYVDGKMQAYLTDGLDIARGIIPDFHEPGGEGPIDESLLAQLPDEPFMMFVGALRLIKGLEPLIAAYVALGDGAPPLVLIGTRAPDTPSEFPPGVRVLHDVPNATVMRAWDRAMFGLAPSTLPEPLGNVIHEAMSRGRPVIGTTPGGHSDIIDDGVNGLLVPAGDVPALTAAMRRLIDDGELRERFGEAALTTAQRFTPEPVLDAFEDLYRETMAVAAR